MSVTEDGLRFEKVFFVEFCFWFEFESELIVSFEKDLISLVSEDDRCFEIGFRFVFDFDFLFELKFSEFSEFSFKTCFERESMLVPVFGLDWLFNDDDLCFESGFRFDFDFDFLLDFEVELSEFSEFSFKNLPGFEPDLGRDLAVSLVKGGDRDFELSFKFERSF